MSVSVDICKDVEKYKETVIGGFDLKQSLSLIGGLLCGGITGAVSVFVLHIPMMFITYIIMVVAKEPSANMAESGLDKSTLLNEVLDYFVLNVSNLLSRMNENNSVLYNTIIA